LAPDALYTWMTIIFGETLEEHHTRLREVLDKLRQYNLKIEPDKCEF